MRLIDADALDYELGASDRDIYVRECLAEAPSVVVEPHWIPVEQALPEQDKICLVCGKNGGIYVARFWRNENIVLWTKTGTGKFVNAVAWMPLPEAFKGVTDGND